MKAYIDFIPGENKKFLNQTLEYFDVNRLENYSIEEFRKKYFRLNIHDGELWGVRAINKKGGGGKFYYALSTFEVIQLFDSNVRGAIKKKYHYNYFICPSMIIPDNNNLIYNGEVCCYKDSYNEFSYMGWLNRKEGMSVREAQYDRNIEIIKYKRQVLSKLIDLIFEKNLIGYVIEFSSYNILVGNKKDGLLIWEIRKY